MLRSYSNNMAHTVQGVSFLMNSTLSYVDEEAKSQNNYSQIRLLAPSWKNNSN